MILVETWPVSQFRNFLQQGRLVLDPEYQRKPVWSAKTKMLFIDSIARKIPAGAITVFDDDTSGYSKYEVIDGRQRLTALKEYVESDLAIKETITAASTEDEDMLELGAELALKVTEAETYDKLDLGDRLALDDYQFPVFIVKGTRAEAVRAFVRMNSNLYSLKPQEIRNAVFTGTRFLKEAIGLSDSLSSELTDGDAFFVKLGVMSAEAFRRMQDVQFCLELMILDLEGVQHRRDSIDKYCDLYREPTGTAEQSLLDSIKSLKKVCEQIWILFDGDRMQAHHFPTNGENDFYALVGALQARGVLSQPQLKSLGTDLVNAISEFRRLVTVYMGKVREGEDAGDQYPQLVMEYAGTLLGGQINSLNNRTQRIAILEEVINDVVDTIDGAVFSDLQRNMIWAISQEKVCARCGEIVKHADYHAGHKKSRAMGGRSVVSNGQVEHATCNMEAGAN